MQNSKEITSAFQTFLHHHPPLAPKQLAMYSNLLFPRIQDCYLHMYTHTQPAGRGALPRRALEEADHWAQGGLLPPLPSWLGRERARRVKVAVQPD